MIPQTHIPAIVDIKLAPGDFFFGGPHARVQTLLGSCVAITLWHPVKCIGGMCHYLLPERCASERLTDGSYADDAVSLFLRAVAKHGTTPLEYDVKLFGGGNMLHALGQGTGPVSVSDRNIKTGMRLLREHGFAIKASDVGGSQHRKIYMELWTGDVWVQRG